MLLPPIATLVDDHPTPDSPDSMTLDTQQMDEDIRPPLEGPTLGNSLGTLTTLFEFYHYERRWINQQRNSLQDDPGLDPVCRESSGVDENSPSSSPSLSPGESSKLRTLKSEPEEICISDSSKSQASSTLRFSRWPWSDRMREPLELKLNARSSRRPGISDPRLILPPAGRRTESAADDTGTGRTLITNEIESSSDTAILDLFENMMEARLESCQRIDKLVRRAHGRQADIVHGGFTRSIGDRRMTTS
ncbi:hypothetical protein J3R30DRAFT_3702995 [Lentinula aciculospora]|uniref:Uncharacterized protein n=1 Tax=Lentinula aciculospora TaxID=153920 RepID=A0A9W9ABF6_9AGAR|nr:hypothetical protein J3R30DRAFT_3702995 [Lentinula aciculospora]